MRKEIFMGFKYRCGLCDYKRQVKTLEENRGKTKVETDRNIKAWIICTHPESPHYGKNRKKNNLPCKYFHDWFYRFDSDGDKDVTRSRQLEFVNCYRQGVLGLGKVDTLPPM